MENIGKRGKQKMNEKKFKKNKNLKIYKNKKTKWIEVWGKLREKGNF